MKHRSTRPALRPRRTLTVAGAAAVLSAGLFAAASVTGSGAYFSHTVTNSGNAFTAGTVEISATDDGSAPFVPFAVPAMAPGSSAFAPLTITNTGSLSLRYSIVSTLTAKSAASGGLQDGTQFAKDLQLFGSIDPALTPAHCAAETGAGDSAIADAEENPIIAESLADSSATIGTPVNVMGNPAPGAQSGDRTLAPGASETICLQITLPAATAANADQGASMAFTLGIDAEQTKNN